MNSTCGKYVGTSGGNNSIDANSPTLRERRFIQVIVAVVYSERGDFKKEDRSSAFERRVTVTDPPPKLESG
jgi:hypothetical protein